MLIHTKSSRTNTTTDYTISRSASNKTDMGNRLYFRLHKDPNVSNSYYGVSIKSFVIYFAADADFDQPLQALPFSTPVGVSKASFMVGKPALGTIKPNTKNGKTYYSYDYRNVGDLEADNLLYQASAVKDGKADDSSTATKTITRTINENSTGTTAVWYALAKSSNEEDNTYYVESPVTLLSESGHELPTGYRITGAKFEFGYGEASQGGYIIGTNRHGEITYLHADGTMGSSNPETRWQLNTDRSISLNGSTIYARYTGNFFSTGYYYLTTQSRGNTRLTFRVDERNRVYTTIGNNRLYIHENARAGQGALLSADTEDAAVLMNYSAFTPSASGYTATVYDKTGNNVAETANISIGNNAQTITLTGLNNDAVKFKISNLADGGQALVRVTLTMEHLNPYIHSMDIIGKNANNASDTTTLRQNFTADNFNVRGGHFVFNVPKGELGTTWNFEFDNLTSNYVDETYPNGSADGNARVAFVESKYFKNAENVYNSNPDYTPVSDKLQVVTVGTVPFRFNNADQLSNTSDAEFESELEEYPFSVAGYLKNTGYTDENGDSIKGSFEQVHLTAGQENMAYIIVADETRYNIAPTTATEHRFYAHYAMDIELQEKEYHMTVTPKQVYKTTFYTDKDNTDKENSMWGVEISTTEGSVGYVHLSEVIDTLSTICQQKKVAGLDTLTQILYVDMSNLQSVVIPADFGVEYLGTFREMLAPNCLIYLPNSTGYKVDNYAHKSSPTTATYTANANIVLEDKQPFYAPHDIIVPAESYAKYTRQITHLSNGKANITTLVLPFQFNVNQYSEHTNTGTGSDGKTFNVYKLQADEAISSTPGFVPEGYDDEADLVGYDEYVHFTPYEPTTGKSEAYKPYLIYIQGTNQLADNDNFTVLQYGANVIATANVDKAANTDAGAKIPDADNTAKGTLNNQSFTLTPAATMSGCKLAKNDEKSLYFASNRFRSSWTLVEPYQYVYVNPFRSWFDYEGVTSAKNNVFGIAFGTNGDATGIDNIDADKAEKTGTYKFIRNGELYIHTDNGVFTVDGRKVNL